MLYINELSYIAGTLLEFTVTVTASRDCVPVPNNSTTEVVNSNSAPILALNHFIDETLSH